MYSVIRQYQFAEGQVDAMLKQVQAGLLPLLRNSRGFVAYHVVNGGNGSVASVSLFENKEAAEVASRAVAEWAGQHFSQVPERPVQVIEGDVVE